MNRKLLFLASLAMSLFHQVRHGADNAIVFVIDTLWMTFALPVAAPVGFINRHVFGLYIGTDFWRYTGNMALAAMLLWFFPVARVERWFGTFDAFNEGWGARVERWLRTFSIFKGWLRMPSLSRCAATVIDTLHRLKLGKGRDGRLGMIGALATRWRPGNFFVGRWSLGGHIGTLRPSGIAPDGLGITFGRQGSGKSTAVAIPNIALHRGPLIVFDAKGELARACFTRRGVGGNGVLGLGQKTWVFDPLGISGLPGCRYNPLYEIAQEACTDDALRLMMKMAEGLLKTPEGGLGENSWVSSGGRQVAYGLTAYLLGAYPPELQNLVTLRRLLQEGEAAHAAAVAAGEKGKRGITPFEALLLRMRTDVKGRFAHVSAAEAANIEKMGDRQLGAIFSALVEATSWLDLPKFQHAVTGCDFLLRDFMTERISVFVCLPLNELVGFAGGIMRVFLSMFLQTMFQKNPLCKPLPHGPVMCLVDEFPQFGNLPAFCKIGPTMRDYHVKLMILLQDLGQLQDVYGTKEASTFLGCAAFIQVMAMKHTETLEWLVKALGERQVRERQPDGRTVTRVYPLLDLQAASHYLAARAGNQIVLRGDDRPLRLRNANYWWYLPFWMYTPDPRHPEPFLRAWARRRAVKKAAATKSGTQAARGVKSCPA